MRSRNSRLGTAAALAGLIAGTAMAGCSTTGMDASDTITIALAANPTGAFDPYRNREFGISEVAPFTHDSLLYKTPEGEFVSRLAATWKADNTSATFTLTPGITCADGSALTAKDVAAAINFASDAANASWAYGYYTPTAPLTAVGDDASRTVRVTVAQPYGYLLDTVGLLPILCAAGVKDPDSLANRSNGTGPYVVSAVSTGETIELKRRDDYAWGPDGTTVADAPATVVFRQIADETTAANLLLSGDVNIANVSGPNSDRVRAAGLDSADAYTAAAWLNFNQREGRATSDRRVREALVHALDFKEVIAVSTNTHGVAAEGLLVTEPAVCPTNAVAGVLPGQDLERAAKLLDEAGWVLGSDGKRVKDGVPLTLGLRYWTDRSELERPTAELLAARWKAIGVGIEPIGENVGGLVKTLYQTGNFDVYLLGWDLRLGSQFIPYLSGPLPPRGQNFMALDNPEYVKLSAEANATTPPQGCDLWGKAERAVVNDFDLVPISNRVTSLFYRGVTGQLTPVEPTSLRATQ
ncbi:ABC transporter substrate-binding protein [Phytohabitans kaempferiae]|uniref:ABC transporter substrate-binding protein n=1 Tax=Phytohabitans kaempferiae TaxID=1620943 RepID=A0ABV6M7U4_9ACTN